MKCDRIELLPAFAGAMYKRPTAQSPHPIPMLFLGNVFLKTVFVLRSKSCVVDVLPCKSGGNCFTLSQSCISLGQSLRVKTARQCNILRQIYGLKISFHFLFQPFFESNTLALRLHSKLKSSFHG